MLERLDQIAQAERVRMAGCTLTLDVCTSSGCRSAGSLDVKANLNKAIEKWEHGEGCLVRGVGCSGNCSFGPMVVATPRSPDSTTAEPTMYRNVAPEDVPQVLDALDGSPIPVHLQYDVNTPFNTRQTKIVLENSGLIDPERVEEYVVRGGYRALVDTLTEMTPTQVLDEVARSGLRGRGGAGYPTGLKWITVAKAPGPIKYVICNGDEGDPGAFMDRSVMESDPHRLLEGMTIAAYAVGASEGYIYVRGEFRLAVERLRTAIRQAQQIGMLGNNIIGTTFSFNIHIRIGGGVFVCGEETALIASIEGRRGHPRPRPPYPAESGLWGKPTLINNVETFANIAPIIRNGGDWYARIGTASSKGTKVFALTGNVRHNGLIEVPMGITLREIVDEIGGGVPPAADGTPRTCKAIQTGGPSGGCIPASLLDTPVDYESLRALGSIMGSGGMIVMDDSTSMVGIARYFIEFCMSESCGKCIPCRAGTAQLFGLLNKIMAGQATEDDMHLLEELCDVVRSTSLCGLGQAAPNPVLSTLRFFRHEYEALLLPTEPAAEVLT